MFRGAYNLILSGIIIFIGAVIGIYLLINISDILILMGAPAEISYGYLDMLITGFLVFVVVMFLYFFIRIYRIVRDTRQENF